MFPQADRNEQRRLTMSANSLPYQSASLWKTGDEKPNRDASRLCSSKCPNSVQQHPGGPKVVLIVIEDTLTRRGIPGGNPAVKPLD